MRTDAATLGHESGEEHMEGASRLYLREIPDGKEYYVVAWCWLTKDRNTPPAPNPDGRYVRGLMDMRERRQ
ncbi:MAG: hypothetical protein LBQ10_02000 [Desulfovibrio sp.]|nr:hypothetical protein [Desulfovibrio sp.]